MYRKVIIEIFAVQTIDNFLQIKLTGHLTDIVGLRATTSLETHAKVISKNTKIRCNNRRYTVSDQFNWQGRWLNLKAYCGASWWYPSINQLLRVVIESKLYILACELWQFLSNYLLQPPSLYFTLYGSSASMQLCAINFPANPHVLIILFLVKLL